MGRKAENHEAGEQLELIDVTPENMKTIAPLAKQYEKVKQARMRASKREVETKQELLEAVREANMSPLPDGSIRFRANGMTITITPRDELVQVKEDSE